MVSPNLLKFSILKENVGFENSWGNNHILFYCNITTSKQTKSLRLNIPHPGSSKKRGQLSRSPSLITSRRKSESSKLLALSHNVEKWGRLASVGPCRVEKLGVSSRSLSPTESYRRTEGNNPLVLPPIVEKMRAVGVQTLRAQEQGTGSLYSMYLWPSTHSISP